MSKFSFAPQSDHLSKTEYQCKHCGSWTTPNGKAPDEKNRSVNKAYCKHCTTADQRAATDKENEAIKKKI